MASYVDRVGQIFDLKSILDPENATFKNSFLYQDLAVNVK